MDDELRLQTKGLAIVLEKVVMTLQIQLDEHMSVMAVMDLQDARRDLIAIANALTPSAPAEKPSDR